MMPMATVRISEAEAAGNFAGLMAQVRAGAEVVIESGSAPVAVIRPVAHPPMSFAERLAQLPTQSAAVMDAAFASDVQAGIEAGRDPLNPAWD